MRAHTVTRMTRPRRYAWCRAPLLIVLSICALAIPASASATSAHERHGPRLEPPRRGGAEQPQPTCRLPAQLRRRTVVALHLAMVQGAVYDAVNAIDGGHQPYLAGLPAASQSASQRAAVATAAHHVLVGLGIGLVPALPEVVRDRLDALYAEALAGIPGRPKKGGWDCGRGRRGRGNPRGENGRRQIRAVLVHGRRRSRRVASDPAGVHQRPERMGGQRRAVPHPELFAVPDEWAARAHERRLHEGIQRGEGARRPDARESAYPRARGGGAVLHRQCGGAAQPHVPHDLRSRRAQPRRGSTALRDAEHGRGRQRDPLLG